MVHPLSKAEADRAMSVQERIDQYERLHRELIPSQRAEFARTRFHMKKAIPGAINGSLRDLATFILAAKANEIAQCKLLASEKEARQTHPMSRAEFGT